MSSIGRGRGRARGIGRGVKELEAGIGALQASASNTQQRVGARAVDSDAAGEGHVGGSRNVIRSSLHSADMKDTPLMSAQPPHECQPTKPAPTSAREPTRASSGTSAGASAVASSRTSAGASSGASAGASSRTSTGASSITSTGESTKHGRDVHVMQQPSHKQATQDNGVDLLTNYFPLSTEVNWVLQQYCVEFRPEVVDKGQRKRLLYHHRDVIGPRKIFDGRSLYLPNPLPLQETRLRYELNDGTTGFIDLTYTNTVENSSVQCAQIYNIIIRTQLHTMGMKEIGRHFYMPSTCQSLPKHKLDVLTGVTTSIQPCFGGWKLLVDLSFKVLCQMTMLDELYSIFDEAKKEKVDFPKLCDTRLLGKIVISRYNNRTYTIDGLDFDCNPSSQFKLANGDKISYADYMMQQHHLKVTDPDQPLLITKPDRKSSKSLRLIPQFCHLTGIPDTMKADHRVMKDFADHTRLDPASRNRELISFIDTLNSDSKCAEDLKEWRISISTDNRSVKANELQPQKLYCCNRQPLNYDPDRADWTREIRNVGFINPKSFSDWIVFVDAQSKDKRVVENFIFTLKKVSPGMGIKVEDPYQVCVVGQRGTVRDYSDAMKQQLSRRLPKLVICILPRNVADVYNAIKKICYIQYGVANQCIVQRTLQNDKARMTCVTKIAMLANIKMGAELWHVNIPLQHMMVIGIDTYHDSSVRGKSVSAIVCSVNSTISKYVSKVCFNHQYGEFLDGITSCLASALRYYHRMNEKLPEKILIYRDGVGDGQLETVRDYELPQVRDACKNVDGNYSPQITIVVCQKRVSARFSKICGNQLRNPIPGTVISGDVTKKKWNGFFLVSTSVSQGTVKPTHYVIVHSGIEGLSNERLQLLTYKLCHLYYNWLSTVQVPAPCQYAHKMAQMVGTALHEEPHRNLYDQLFYL